MVSSPVAKMDQIRCDKAESENNIHDFKKFSEPRLMHIYRPYPTKPPFAPHVTALIGAEYEQSL